LNALKSFEAAARNGSFHGASEELYVTPSAISHQVKALEEFLGLELFYRRKRKIELTSAGQDYYKSVQRALLEIDRSTQKLISAHKTGHLHLSVAPAFLTRWLLPRITQFYEQNPDVELEISAANGLIDFDRTHTDMAVYFGSGDWDGIEVYFLRHYQLMPVCNPRLLKKHAINKPEDVLAHTLLHVKKRSDEWQTWFNMLGVDYKPAKKGVYLSSGSLSASAATTGVGVALADPGLISEEINLGQLTVPLDIPLPISKSFYLVYQEDRAMTYAMKAFKAWVMGEMSKDMQVIE